MYRSAAHVSVTYLAVECWTLQNVIRGLDRVDQVGSRYTTPNMCRINSGIILMVERRLPQVCIVCKVDVSTVSKPEGTEFLSLLLLGLH